MRWSKLANEYVSHWKYKRFEVQGGYVTDDGFIFKTGQRDVRPKDRTDHGTPIFLQITPGGNLQLCGQVIETPKTLRAIVPVEVAGSCLHQVQMQTFQPRGLVGHQHGHFDFAQPQSACVVISDDIRHSRSKRVEVFRANRNVIQRDVRNVVSSTECELSAVLSQLPAERDCVIANARWWKDND